MLSGSEILKEYLNGNIYINPFTKEHIGPNGYDVTLSKHLLKVVSTTIDMRLPCITEEYIIPPEGIMIYPGQLYLGATNEYCGSSKYVPMYEGRSSVGRLGIETQICAAAGDVGFEAPWTLEIRVTLPTRIYHGVRVGQVMFHPVEGEIEMSYKSSGRYNDQVGPQPSKLFLDFLKDPVC